MRRQPVIDDYDFGEIMVNGVVYDRDLIITPSGVKPNWWRVEGHRLQLTDVQEVVNADVDVVVIGTGYDGRMIVDDDVIKAFKERGAEVYVLKSRQAVKKYNEEVEKGRKVLLLIHLTC